MPRLVDSHNLCDDLEDGAVKEAAFVGLGSGQQGWLFDTRYNWRGGPRRRRPRKRHYRLVKPSFAIGVENLHAPVDSRFVALRNFCTNINFFRVVFQDDPREHPNIRNFDNMPAGLCD